MRLKTHEAKQLVDGGFRESGNTSLLRDTRELYVMS